MEKSEIEQLYFNLREEMNQQWKRTLPMGELFVNRWEKAEFLNFGKGTSIYDSSIVMGQVDVGENTWIGPNTLLDGTGGSLTIGKGCNISAGVQIYTHDTVKRCLSEGKAEIDKGAVSIGDFCYIAPMSIIAKGVTIGSHCVVAAHSFVKQSCEDFAIIAGIPAVQIGRVVIENDEVKLEYFAQSNGAERGGKNENT